MAGKMGGRKTAALVMLLAAVGYACVFAYIAISGAVGDLAPWLYGGIAGIGALVAIEVFLLVSKPRKAQAYVPPVSAPAPETAKENAAGPGAEPVKFPVKKQSDNR